MCKAYLFSRNDKTIEIVSFEDTPEHLRVLLNCERFTPVKVDDNHIAYVDEDEPLTGSQPCTKFSFCESPIIGNLLIVGSDIDNEDALSPTLSPETVASFVDGFGTFDWYGFVNARNGIHFHDFSVIYYQSKNTIIKEQKASLYMSGELYENVCGELHRNQGISNYSNSCAVEIDPVRCDIEATYNYASGRKPLNTAEYLRVREAIEYGAESEITD